MRYFIAVIFSLLLCASLEASASKEGTHYKRLSLSEYTNLDLYIVPDLGTRLIFPFVLTNEAHEPHFTHKLTNGSYFKLTKENEIIGQNNFVIYFTPPAEGGQVGNILADLFISVDGYNVSIRLHTTDRLSKHTRNVVFDISEEERNGMVERQVAYQLDKATKELAEKELRLNERAQRLSDANMGIIAMYEPKVNKIKERFKNKLLTGEQVDLIAESFRNYNDQFYMLEFTVDNSSPKNLSIESVSVRSVSDETEESLDVSYYCDKGQEIGADKETRCFVISSNAKLIEAEKIGLQVDTNRGVLRGVW